MYRPLIALLLWVSGGCQSEAVREEAAAPAGLGWLAGDWYQAGAEGLAEEHWTQLGDGTLYGLGRAFQNGELAFWEYLRVAPRPGGSGLAYHAAPRGAGETVFPLVEQQEHRVVFENRGHDFPQRILYWMDPEGRLHARIEGPVGGELQFHEWTFQRR